MNKMVNFGKFGRVLKNGAVVGENLEEILLNEAKPQVLYEYARDVIKGAWPIAEAIIAKSPEWSLWYAVKVKGSRFVEGEEAIKQDPRYAYLYAKEVMMGRWLEGEPAVLKSPENSYFYAREVVQGPWFEAEDTIKKDALSSFYYADHVLNNRFIAAEPTLVNSSLWNKYSERFGVQRDEVEAEDKKSNVFKMR